MLVKLRVPAAPQATLYQQVGDVLGWLCVGAGVVVIGIGRKPKRSMQ
jgi:hypothetical protein